MAYIKFKNSDEYIKAAVLPTGVHVVRINLDTEPVLTGFHLYLDSEGKYPLDNGEYEAYNTLYRQGEGWYELSNDGSVYTEPTEPEILPPEEPTEEEKAEQERQRQIAECWREISELKAQLDSTDYQIIKTYEYSLVGLDPDYDIETLHQERQNLRNQINDLQAELQTQLNEM